MSDDSSLIRPLSDLFPATSRWIYVDAATAGLLPESARERMSGVLEAQLLASFGENHALSMLQSCREFFARLVGAAAPDIQLCPATDGAMSAVAARLELRRRSNIVLCTALSRPSFASFWREQARHLGLALRDIPVDPEGFVVASLDAFVDDGTALVALPMVSHARGWRLPVVDIGRLCRARQAFLLVDASAGIGLLGIDVARDGIDGLIVAADGNALGVQGTAFLFLSKAWGGMADAFLRRRRMGGSRPELPPLLSLAAAQEALRVVERCGVAEIERHALGLAERLRTALEELGMPVERPRIDGQLGHVASVGLASGAADSTLRDQGLQKFAEQLTAGRVRYAVRGGQLQFGFHLYNCLRDVMDVRRIAAQSMA